MKKLNITKIIFTLIDCNHCDRQFKVYHNGEWSDIKEMKIIDKRLLFSCPYCDHISIDETDFSSICRDLDEDSMELMKAKKRAFDLYNQINIGYNYEKDEHIGYRMYGTQNKKE